MSASDDTDTLDAVVDSLAARYGLSATEANIVRVAFHALRSNPEEAAAVLGGDVEYRFHPDGVTYDRESFRRLARVESIATAVTRLVGPWQKFPS